METKKKEQGAVIVCNVSKNKEAEINLRRVLIELGMLKEAERRRNVPNLIIYILSLPVVDINRLAKAIKSEIGYSNQLNSYTLRYE